MIKNFLFVFLFIFAGISLVTAQVSADHNLALQYYNKGEYEKAVELFEDLYENDPNSQYYYKYYYNTLLKLQEYKKIEKLTKKQLKRQPDNLTVYVDQGYAYSQQGELDKAQEQYDAAIKNLRPIRNQVIQVANSFTTIREFDLAIETYLKGRSIINDYPFYFEIANLYRSINESEKMIANFLEYMNYNPAQNQYILSVFQDNLDKEEFARELQKQLYKKIQENPQDAFYNEILIWLFIQKKDFESAFTQLKALDRRFSENGFRIYDFAKTAMTEEKYDVAISAYQYLLDKGVQNRFYYNAREGMLSARKGKILSGFEYSDADLAELEKEYYDFISEFGNNKLKASATLKDYAELQAFYLHNLDKGIKILEDLVQVSGLSNNFTSECKLSLGDCYLIKGDIWEATLLYSQVDKKMKDEPLGEMARFKNAKLSYYAGDFGWSQTQLDVLKASTSELIANDALDLSVFITSNLGLDTTAAPMQMFARADLLTFQNKFDEALLTLDSINTKYPKHTLGDDLYFLQAEIHLKRKNTEKALAFLEKIVEEYPQELLADDALFLLGDIYERKYQNKEKAMEYFQKIIVDHSGSIYVIDARERFRALRGDKLN